MNKNDNTKEQEEKWRFFSSKTKREIEENSYLFQESTQSILDKRFRICLYWYIRNACFYKKVFYVATFLSAVCPMISVGLNSLIFSNTEKSCVQYGAFLLSITAGISVAILSMSRAQDKWTRYRISAEFLKRKRVEYLIEKGREDNKCIDLDLKYLKIIEEFMANENDQWRMENQDKEFGNSSDSKRQRKSSDETSSSEVDQNNCFGNKGRSDGL